jgi:NAD(P)-dependent dehydrogenase (short-subunit alcohol dehydrogenase family)
MNPAPVTDNAKYVGSGKLKDRAAVITGGDSGIGQAVAIAFAKEGADVAIVYLDNNEDAAGTKQAVESYGRRCFPYALDLKAEQSAADAVMRVMKDLGKIDVLVNNIGVQYPQNSIEDILAEQLVETFETNIFSYFYMIKACLPNLKEGASIINTASITAYKGDETLIDYSATKGAVVSMTRSLSMSLIKRGIRVNAVAPGPVWTPLIPSSFSPQDVEKFGQDTPIGRAAQPFELAPTYVYLASDDSAYVSGQVLHVNGGVITDS